MATPGSQNLMPEGEGLTAQLSKLFGSYKAEWLRDQIYELFAEPAYFPELQTPRSCVLIGGRGTGKTTVLRGLSYEGQEALAKRRGTTTREAQFYGLYYRVNTNHVTAFRGPELSDEAWIPLFAHYINLLFCEQMLDFLAWYQLRGHGSPNLAPKDCDVIAQSFHLSHPSHQRELHEGLSRARVAFEAYVNNVCDAPRPLLSLQSAPLDLLTAAVLSLPEFAGKQFYFLLDEYENLLDYQQQVINTLIKHAAQDYCFKIGVRELGWRVRSTLNPNEQLIHPADYVLINITDRLSPDTFRTFAYCVCQERLARLSTPNGNVISDVRAILPGVSEEEEAHALGIDEMVADLQMSAAHIGDEKTRAAATRLSPLEFYFVKFWADAQAARPLDVLLEYASAPHDWQTRFGNYKHALLYTLRRGKRGIRKYYAGWQIFTQLAAGNIRYLLELVDQSLLAHLRDGGSLATPVPPRMQTIAAQEVGHKSLTDLEGLSVDGAQLTKLLLSLGRVYQVMASEPSGHAPEVNQFHVEVQHGYGCAPETEQRLAEVDRLLNSAVMHLALIRSAGNKLGDVGDTRDYDYMVHPIFAPFFVFSYRRKRKMTLAPDQLLGLIRRPKETIRAILRAHNRTRDDALPEQLLLFEGFYRGDF